MHAKTPDSIRTDATIPCYYVHTYTQEKYTHTYLEVPKAVRHVPEKRLSHARGVLVKHKPDNLQCRLCRDRGGVGVVGHIELLKKDCPHIQEETQLVRGPRDGEEELEEALFVEAMSHPWVGLGSGHRSIEMASLFGP